MLCYAVKIYKNKPKKYFKKGVGVHLLDPPLASVFSKLSLICSMHIYMLMFISCDSFQ